MAGKDVQDKLCAVYHAYGCGICKVLLLQRCEVITDDDCRRAKVLYLFVQLFGFTRSDIVCRVRFRAFLMKLADSNGSGALNELPELFSVPFYIFQVWWVGYYYEDSLYRVDFIQTRTTVPCASI
jgi:hypothetical protein